MLTNQQVEAIRLYLIEGKSWAEIAREINIDFTTVYRWRNGEEFSKELTRLSDKLLSEAIALNFQRQLTAYSALEEIMKNPKNAAKDRIEAARTTLEQTIRIKESVSSRKLEEQLASLEAVILSQEKEEMKQLDEARE